MRQVRCPALFLIFFGLGFSETQSTGRRSYELRGVVIPDSGISLDDSRFGVQLLALSGAWSGRALSAVPRKGGHFRYKHIPSGTYLLTVFVPRVSRVRRTVEVGPSLADKDGRIEIRVPFSPRRRTPAAFQVRANELPVPSVAREEYEKGLREVRQRNLVRAEEHFRRAIELAPHYSAAWYELGAMSSRQQRFDDAANFYREALKTQPENFRALVDLGGVLLMSRHAEEALEINAQAVKIRADDAEALVQFGFSLMLADRSDEAEMYLKKAVTLDPANYSYPQLMLAEIYRRRKDLAAVQREFEEFLRLHPDSPKAREIRPALEELRLVQ